MEPSYWFSDSYFSGSDASCSASEDSSPSVIEQLASDAGNFGGQNFEEPDDIDASESYHLGLLFNSNGDHDLLGHEGEACSKYSGRASDTSSPSDIERQDPVAGSVDEQELDQPDPVDVSKSNESDSPGSGSNADHDSESTESCACGNKGHKNLTAWYARYTNPEFRHGPNQPRWLAFWQSLDDDELDRKRIRQHVSLAMDRVEIRDDHCANCRRVLKIWNEKPFETIANSAADYHEDAYEFEASCQKRCHLCLLLLQLDRRRNFRFCFDRLYKLQGRLECLRRPSESWKIRIVKNDDAEKVWVLLPPEIWDCDGLFASDSLQLVQDASKPPKVALDVPDRFVGLDLAKQWLRLCLDTHSCLGAGDSTHSLPIRLIDVRSQPVRLIVTADLVGRPEYAALKYATLSHCWGDVDFLTLTKESLNQFTKFIPENGPHGLSKTFRDAISITRSLDLDFLWIDSLCIIQNSVEDWRQESVLMSEVYGGSTINIAAAGAPDGTHGCFMQPEGYVGKFCFQALSRSTHPHHCLSPLEAPPPHMVTTHMVTWTLLGRTYSESVDDSPLCKRGWVLQERILAPRTLFFTNTEIFWECKRLTASETFPDKDQGPGARDDDSIYLRSWNEVVWLYTRAQLTYRSDKLVALSGIAREFQKQTGDAYFGGLWRKNMEEQLLWVGHEPVSWSERVLSGTQYIAPSWSWASLPTASIVHPLCDPNTHPRVARQYFAHVLDVSTISCGPNLLGQLSGGSLTMSCKLIMAGKLIKRAWGGYTVYEPRFKTFGHYVGRGIALDTDGFEGPVFILPVTSEFVRSSYDYQRETVRGLVLAESLSKRGEYYRAGYFEWYTFFDEHRRRIDETIEAMRMRRGVNKAHFAKFLSKPKYPDEHYIITII